MCSVFVLRKNHPQTQDCLLVRKFYSRTSLSRKRRQRLWVKNTFFKESINGRHRWTWISIREKRKSRFDRNLEKHLIFVNTTGPVKDLFNLFHQQDSGACSNDPKTRSFQDSCTDLSLFDGVYLWICWGSVWIYRLTGADHTSTDCSSYWQSSDVFVVMFIWAKG